MEVGQSAFKHGIVLEDIEHAVRNAMAIDDLDEDLRLHLGPTCSGSLLELISVARDGGDEFVIHAMAMRPRYRRLLPGGS